MREVADKLLATDKKFFFCVTGASLIFTENLMAFGGASNNVIGTYQPYAYEQLATLVNLDKGDKCVCEDTAKRMVGGVIRRFKLPINTIVVSCTASLCKRDAERADRANEAYIAISTPFDFIYGSITNSNKTIVKHFTYNKIQAENNSVRYMQEKTLANDILYSLMDYINEVSKV